MKLPLFTLIHTPAGASSGAAPEFDLREFGNISKTLKRAMVATRPTDPEAIQTLARRLEAAKKSIGIWDLGAWAGHLPEVIESMNDAQRAWVFMEILAPVPAGLKSVKSRVIAWGEHRLGQTFGPRKRGEQMAAVIDEEFFQIAAPVRKELGLDYVIGISPDAVAGVTADEHEGETLYSDLISSPAPDGKMALVSTWQFRKFAAAANRRFEFAVAYAAAAAMFVLTGGDKVDFHTRDRGCLLDGDYRRANMIRGLRHPKLCDECRAGGRPDAVKAIDALLQKLDEYPRPEAELASA